MKLDPYKTQVMMAKRKINVYELAEATGISRATISSIVAGKRGSNLPSTIGKVAEALSCDVEDVTVREDSES